MKGLIFLTILLGVPAFAGGKQPPKPSSQTVNQEQTAHGGKAVSGSESHSAAISGSMSGSSAENTNVVDTSSGAVVGIKTGETSLKTGDTNLTGGSTDVHIEGDHFEGDTETWNLPSNAAFAPNGYTVIDCSAVLGAAYTNKNGSGSLGIPIPRWLDGLLFQRVSDCEAVADAVWLAEMGFLQASIEARCTTKSMRRLFGGGAKGKKDRAKECVSKIAASVISEAKIEELNERIDELKNSNQALRNAVLDSQEAVERCTYAWEDCQTGSKE